MKKTVLLLSFFISIHLFAQNVAGYWYGTASVANAGSSNNYLVELILNQSNSTVKGIINYYFKNTYRSLQVKGSYNSGTRELVLLDIPVPYYGSSGSMSVDCSMNLVATHRVAQAGSDLNGRFIGKEEYKYTCPEIVFDFKLNKDAGNQDSILTALRNFKETKQLWTPSGTDTVVAATVIQRKIQNPVVNQEFSQRTTSVQKEIEVSSDSIKVDFYDNGEIDGDSISVFFNNQLLGSNLRLSTHAIHLDLGLDTTREVNTISMFANNLGTIPPNTALMLVYDGQTRYEVRLSSNLESNAAVNIRRKKKGAGRRL